jgi:hypothetical protein
VLRFRLMVKRGPHLRPQASEGEAWHSADDAGRALSPGACEDVTQSEAADAADPSQAASIEGHCHRERPTCHLAQLVNLTLSCRCSPSIASSELGWKPDPCRNGFIAFSPKRACVETRHMRAMLKAQINKTDRNDARSMAYFAGLDVSVKETRVCIVDDAGKKMLGGFCGVCGRGRRWRLRWPRGRRLRWPWGQHGATHSPHSITSSARAMSVGGTSRAPQQTAPVIKAFTQSSARAS